VNGLKRLISACLRRAGLGTKSALTRAGEGFRGVLDATIADIPAIVEFEPPMFQEHMAQYPQDFAQPFTEEGLTEMYVRIFSRRLGGAAIYLAEGAALGYVSWIYREYFGVSQVLIHSISVNAGHRRSGVARAPIDHARAHARDRGAACVRANVWEHNEASRAFFRAVGFERISEVYGAAVPSGDSS